MSGYAGTATLVRLALRRDRLVIPLSIVGLVALAGGSAKSSLDLFQGQATIDATRALLASPAILAMYGPVANPDNPDSFAVFKTLLLGAVALAILAVVVVRRHTRTEEEAGRTELVGAGVVGRRAPLTAAVIVSAGTVLVTSALAAASLVGAGLGPTGSVAFGAAWASAGLVFTGVTAVAAQLTATTRGCGAWALGALAVAYLLRAVGDTATGAASALTWLSPLGWAEKIEVFGENRLVVALLPLAVSGLLVVGAYALQARRDIGSGLLAARPGPRRAPASLRSPWALAWRLQRATLLGWAVAYAVLGVVLGGVAGSVGAIASSAQMQDLLRKLGGTAGSITDIFVSTEVQFLAIGAAAYGISAALRLRSEEADLHTEQVLATGATRRVVLASHALVALLGSALLMLLLGASLALGTASGSDGFAAALGHVLPSALATIPPVWVCVGLALAIFGSAPRVVYAAWGLLALFVFVGEFGSLVDLPQVAIDLSPFVHAAVVPGTAVVALPLVVLLALAGALVTAAGVAFRRRDIG
ncbi:polyketide antibiotic transporter [Lapillicoccus sp.]|uniref:ABC transporter permease n=1 Tax=Lapillicoccus sp. TaxID=1909287 RepID=UPI0032637A31